MRTTDYQHFEASLENYFDTMYELYMTIKYKHDHGSFQYKEVSNGYVITEVGSGQELFLTEKSRDAFLTYLTYKWAKDGHDIESYKNYLELCDKDD